MRQRVTWRCLAGSAVLATLATVAFVPRVGARSNAIPPPRTVAEADSMIRALPPSKERLTAFRTWCGGASLDDLMYLLRRPSAELGDLEGTLATAALGRAPAERRELRARLALRESAATHRDHHGAPADAPPGALPIPAFHVTLLLPASGDHAADAVALEAGFRAGLASRAAPGRPAIVCAVARTGDDEPVRAAAAFDSVSTRTALVCGGFQRASAQLLAAASRWSGVPVLLAADDAGATRLADRVWSMGPTAAQRGESLAVAVGAGPDDRVAVITSSASDTAFADAFVAACRARGVQGVVRFGYASGNTGFVSEARALIAQKCSVLFWDGDASEAAALLRQLTRERVSIRVCGGTGLDPARHHKESRLFLEGVVYVAEDWTLTSGAEMELETRLGGPVAPSAQALVVRGWLAGRVAGEALASTAYTSAEIAAAISALSPRPGADTRLMGVARQGGELPIYRVSAGRPTPITR